ncbi:hypothetical protein NL676_028831 [Syzygium grande]|nr:hypothetical protein NL676_028831 [Syzygium grande]
MPNSPPYRDHNKCDDNTNFKFALTPPWCNSDIAGTTNDRPPPHPNRNAPVRMTWTLAIRGAAAVGVGVGPGADHNSSPEKRASVRVGPAPSGRRG